MNKTLLAYQQQLLSSFAARDSGDIELEDDILADLDKLWLSMTPEERELSRGVARQAREQHLVLLAIQGCKVVGTCVSETWTRFRATNNLIGVYDVALIGQNGPTVRRSQEPLTPWSFGVREKAKFGQIERSLALN